MGRPRKHPRRWYRCIVAFGGHDQETGMPFQYRVGDLAPDTEKVVKSNPDWFEPLDTDMPIPQAYRDRYGA